MGCRSRRTTSPLDPARFILVQHVCPRHHAGDTEQCPAAGLESRRTRHIMAQVSCTVAGISFTVVSVGLRACTYSVNRLKICAHSTNSIQCTPFFPFCYSLWTRPRNIVSSCTKILFITVTNSPHIATILSTIELLRFPPTGYSAQVRTRYEPEPPLNKGHFVSSTSPFEAMPTSMERDGIQLVHERLSMTTNHTDSSGVSSCSSAMSLS
jgi:hypothetical protein